MKPIQPCFRRPGTSLRRPLLRAPVCLFVFSGSGLRFFRPNEHAKTGKRRRLHKEDQGIPVRPAIHDRTGRSPARILQSTHATEVSGNDARSARRTVLHRGHQPLLRRAGQRIRRARSSGSSAKSEEGRDMVVLAIGNEESIKNLEKIQSRSRRPHRSPQDHRGAGAKNHPDQQAHLLDHQRHPLPETGGPRCWSNSPTALSWKSLPSSRRFATMPSSSSRQ